MEVETISQIKILEVPKFLLRGHPIMKELETKFSYAEMRRVYFAEHYTDEYKLKQTDVVFGITGPYKYYPPYRFYIDEYYLRFVNEKMQVFRVRLEEEDFEKIRNMGLEKFGYDFEREKEVFINQIEIKNGSTKKYFVDVTTFENGREIRKKIAFTKNPTYEELITFALLL